MAAVSRLLTARHSVHTAGELHRYTFVLKYLMDGQQARKLYLEHATAMAYVDVEMPDGTREIGSAFHVGEGVFVTARHVVENEIREIRISEPLPVRASEMFPELPDDRIQEWDDELEDVLGHVPFYKHWEGPLSIDTGPLFPENPNLDLAVFKVEDIHEATGVVKLGVHWDDWVYRRPWRLSEAVVLGYPPIPMTNEPHLVAARAEVHTYVHVRHSPHIHFILSTTPRGGYSGGLAVHEGEFALGVVTSSLVRDQQATELGFQAVLSIEPIRNLLEDCDLLPDCQEEYREEVLGIDSQEDD